MSLAPGTRLGPYEIVAPVGAGGMGEVYRARDTRIDRTVAIKVLPSDASASPEAAARFEREARAIARFSHPHICQLHDLGVEDQTAFLVMELIDGETLAVRLAKGALPFEDVRRYGIAIADALDAAHRAGIVHRDLKPGNIMLPRSGLKLLDFGLAKGRDVAADATLTPTLAPITSRGAVAGTVAYMAPEVLEGQPADERSDVYSLGSVLYEMATGRRYYNDSSQAVVPEMLERIVRGCLARDPEERWQSARDVRLQLASLPAADSVPVVGAPQRWGLTAGRAGWAVAVLAAGVATVSLIRSREPAESAGMPAIRFAVPPPRGGAFYDNVENAPIAVAPDGSQLAFSAIDSDRALRIWIRPMTAVDAQPIAGTEGATALTWSSDSKSIAFLADGKIKRIDLPGGSAVTLCEYKATGVSMTWGLEGQILFSSVGGEAIFRVPANGGTPEPLVKPDPARGELRTVFPWYLPDGRRFLYSVRVKDGAHVMLGSQGAPPREVLSVVSNIQYVDPGYLVFVREGTLVGQRFDPDRAELSGTPFSIAGPIRYNYSTSAARFATAPGGLIVFHAGFDKERLVWVDRNGSERGTVGDTGIYGQLKISPDARRLLFSRGTPQVQTSDLWVTEFERGGEQRLTSDPTSEVNGIWHPDGASIYFSADRGGPPHVYRKNLRTGVEAEMTQPGGLQLPEAISPDRKVVFTARAGANMDLWTIPADGGARTPLLQSAFNEAQAQFSPDGRVMAVTSNESGRYEIYLTPYPTTGEKTLVSRTGGSYPRWSRDGRELFYLAPDRHMVSVPVRTTPSLHIGQPTKLFALPGRRSWKDFDVSPDGARFLAIVTDVLGDEEPLTVITNWKPDLRR